MSVSKATVFFPACLPIETIVSASFCASGRVFIKAPLPTFTSSRMASQPEQSFLLIMEEAMRGMLSTVEVASRKA